MTLTLRNGRGPHQLVRAFVVGSPGDVQVIALVYDFLRSGASGRDPLGKGGSPCKSESVTAACEVCCASFEVVRARDATQSPIALRSAAAGGNSQSRMSGQ